MRYGSMIGLCAAALMAGAAAEARTPEARNPFHCSIALQISYELAKEARGADSAIARELHTRLVWQALAAARFPKAPDADAQAAALRTQFLSDSETGVALAEACMRRQDAHPSFREARLEKQLSDGVPQEPLSIRASVDELKTLIASR